MTIETQINLDMTTNQAPVVVDVVQGEQMTRVVSATLYDGAQPWSVPGGVKAGLAFRKPDGTGGLYDELPNKSPAVTVSGNTVKVTLAPQVQSVAGDVAAAIVFMVPSTMERLATFPFILRVAKDPSTGSPASNNYYKYSTMEEVNAAIKDVQSSANAATEAVAGFQQSVASALLVTMTGPAVSTDMVSPIAHELHCSISGVPDTTTVKVSQYGGNIFDISSLTKAEKWVFDGTAYTGYLYRLYNAFNFSNGGIIIPNVSGLICTVSATVKSPDSGGQLYVLINYQDDTNDSLIFSDSAKYVHKSFTAKKPISLISMSYKGVDGIAFIKEMSVSVGSTAIETPYVPPKVFKPESDGSVKGIISRSPDMTILTDSPNVTVEATYNADTKKYIDKKFDALKAAIISTGGSV